MKRFQFIWKNGDIDEAEGRNVAEAFTSLGYGAGALGALDYYKEIKK